MKPRMRPVRMRQDRLVTLSELLLMASMLMLAAAILATGLWL